LDLANNLATETWNYPNGQSIYSPICSSVYEDQPLNYLIDYAAATPQAPILLGLNSAGNQVFNYQYTGSGNSAVLQAWNAIQIHFERVALTSPNLISVVSRITQGMAGTFDIDLPLAGRSGVECRTSSASGSGNYRVVFTFANNVTAVGAALVSSGTGLVSSSTIGPNPNQYTVNLSGVSNEQTIQVTLADVVDSLNNSGSITVPMRVLIGDSNGDGSVNSADIGQTKSQSGQTVTKLNFREDVNGDGVVNSADIGLVKSKSGTSTP
jgi:hypothetical protein